MDKKNKNYNIVLTGGTLTGKTVMFEIFSGNVHSSPTTTTLTTNFKKTVQISGQSITINYWDTVSDKKLWSLTQRVLPNSDITLLVFSYMDKQSYIEMKEFFFCEVKKHAPTSQSKLFF